jgi:hypothetical protein
MFEQHIVIPVEDLRFLELYCNRCGNGYLLDMDMSNEASSSIPNKCPPCPETGAGFNAKCGPELDAKSFFHQFRDFRKAMRAFTKAETTSSKDSETARVKGNFRRPQFRIKTVTSAQTTATSTLEL